MFNHIFRASSPALPSAFCTAYRKRAHSRTNNHSKSPIDGLLYSSSAAIFMVGLVYAAVPFYRMFCEETGFGGTLVKKSDAVLKSNNVTPVPGAMPVKITFAADTGRDLPWQFKPEQRSVSVIPGQTALAFYNAKNLGHRDIVGMATYNIIPSKAAQYFNKIQCFCFEEQRLLPGEEVDMPIFFYLDPEYAFDPRMERVEEIILSYTFFESKENRE